MGVICIRKTYTVDLIKLQTDPLVTTQKAPTIQGWRNAGGQ